VQVDWKRFLILEHTMTLTRTNGRRQLFDFDESRRRAIEKVIPLLWLSSTTVGSVIEVLSRAIDLLDGSETIGVSRGRRMSSEDDLLSGVSFNTRSVEIQDIAFRQETVEIGLQEREPDGERESDESGGEVDTDLVVVEDQIDNSV
jgi:hypothetical protein